MRVLLLNGPDNRKDSVMVRSGDRWPRRVPRKIFKDSAVHPYPILLSYAAAVLQDHGMTPFFLDAIIESLDLDETIVKIKNIAPDLLIIDTSTPTIATDLLTAKRVKEEIGIPIVLINTHATYFHDTLIQEPFVDFIVRGEFEFALAEIAVCLRNKGDFSSIAGITYKQNGAVIITPERELLKDLDVLPYPHRDLIQQKRYKQELLLHKPYFMIMGSRGCPFRCIFCLWVPTLFKNKVRLRNVSKVVDEIEYLQKNYGAREVFFYDDTVNVSIQRVTEICTELVRRGVAIAWGANLRADKCSPKMFQLMKRAGCRQVIIGVESGSQKLLDEVIHKKITLDQVRNAVQWAGASGIAVHCTFVLGFPGETIETLKETARFIKEISPDSIQFGLATPYPGTAFYEMIKKERKEWQDFDGLLGETYCELSSAYLRNAIHRMYIDYYLSLPQIKKKLLSMTTLAGVQANWRLLKGFLGRYLATGIPKKLERKTGHQ